MTGDAPTTVVWIAPAPPDAAQSGALASWARERGVRLVEPVRATPRGLPIDLTVAGEIEALLSSARDANVAREGAAADRALDAAEARLRAHAELPQGAWLMAEIERARSTRWRRADPVDLEAAERAAARADALDGGRVAGVGEQAAAGQAQEARLTVRVPGGGRAWIDGRPVEGDSAGAQAGLHAIRVTWRGRTVWATWVDVPAGDTTLVADAPGTAPCSEADFEGARLSASGQPATHGVEASDVLCPQWVAAAPGASAGAISVALCGARACGPLLDWHTPPVALFAGLPATGRVDAVDHGGRWPAWATWAVVGAGAAIATGVVLVAAGAFKGPATETVFVNGGLKSQ